MRNVFLALIILFLLAQVLNYEPLDIFFQDLISFLGIMEPLFIVFGVVVLLFMFLFFTKNK